MFGINIFVGEKNEKTINRDSEILFTIHVIIHTKEKVVNLVKIISIFNPIIYIGLHQAFSGATICILKIYKFRIEGLPHYATAKGYIHLINIVKCCVGIEKRAILQYIVEQNRGA